MTTRKHNPKFSSGPSSKFSGWSFDYFDGDTLGRSHRSKEGLALVERCISLQRELLELPDDYYLAIMPGSATSAFESALWNLIGPKPVTVFKNGVFSSLWANDVEGLTKECSQNCNVIEAKLGELPELKDPHTDVVITWVETTTGVRMPHANWLADRSDRLVFCDATAAAFGEPLPWHKLDVVAFAWQKVLGAEAAHGGLVLSPKAVKRINSYQPNWIIPRILNLRKSDGTFNEKLFTGHTINTPSLICVQDVIQVLEWAKSNGGAKFLYNKTKENFNVVANWIDNNDKFEFFVKAKTIRALTPVNIVLKKTMRDDDAWQVYRNIAKNLADKGIAFDIVNHTLSAPAIRIWTGPTVEKEDLCRLYEELNLC